VTIIKCLIFSQPISGKYIQSDGYIRYGYGEEALKKLLEHGANIIQTDEPEMLLELLRYNGLHD